MTRWRFTATQPLITPAQAIESLPIVLLTMTAQCALLKADISLFPKSYKSDCLPSRMSNRTLITWWKFIVDSVDSGSVGGLHCVEPMWIKQSLKTLGINTAHIQTSFSKQKQKMYCWLCTLSTLGLVTDEKIYHFLSPFTLMQWTHQKISRHDLFKKPPIFHLLGFSLEKQ